MTRRRKENHILISVFNIVHILENGSDLIQIALQQTPKLAKDLKCQIFYGEMDLLKRWQLHTLLADKECSI